MNSDVFKDRLLAVMGKESKRAFAEKCGVSEGTMRSYLRGDTTPDLDTLQVIAEKNGCSLAWLASGEGKMKRGGEPAVHDAAPRWEPTNGHPASKSAPPDGPEGYSDYELRLVLLRDIIETYEGMRPGREPERKAREITIIYRHFMEHFARHLDEVEISEYIDRWL
ncbi:helix-turn-helix domain-containing protein [Trichlorobacter lovleyi]|uniref:helix-turn-helix domain-containing protein n=1 Tax=Trichlorobacter lovleyi TaxID=313985 RepID=UPI00223FE722|nr:helix-turn-helix transcriptional regulator [Trichlorobacter lovleyi]QOX79835.1 helix-turn-helix domain-containing protein [Trichlorobacter lovleyi]